MFWKIGWLSKHLFSHERDMEGEQSTTMLFFRSLIYSTSLSIQSCSGRLQAIKYYGGHKVKKSLICLLGKSMTPQLGSYLLFCSSQQLPSLGVRHLKGFLSWLSTLRGLSNLTHIFLPQDARRKRLLSRLGNLAGCQNLCLAMNVIQRMSRVHQCSSSNPWSTQLVSLSNLDILTPAGGTRGSLQ